MEQFLIQLQQKENIEQLIKLKINKHEYLKKILHHYMFYLKEVKEIKKIWNEYEIYNYDNIAKKLYAYLLNFNFFEPEKSIEQTNFVDSWIKANSHYFKQINLQVKELYDKWEELFSNYSWTAENEFIKKIYEESLTLKNDLKEVDELEFDKFIYDLENKQKSYYLFIEKLLQLEEHMNYSFIIGEEAEEKVLKLYNNFKNGTATLNTEYDVEAYISLILNNILDIKENNLFMNNKYMVVKVYNNNDDEIGFALKVNGKYLKNNTLNAYEDNELVFEETNEYLYCTNIPYQGIFHKGNPDEMVKLNTEQIKCSQQYTKDVSINFLIGFFILLYMVIDVLLLKHLSLNMIIGVLGSYLLLSIFGNKITRKALENSYKIKDFFSLIHYDFLYVKEGALYMSSLEIDSVLDNNLEEFRFYKENN